MRAPSILVALAAFTACTFAGAPGAGRVPASPAERARPAPDAALRLTPGGARVVPPTEEVAVRLRLGTDGRLVIAEFLAAGLTDADRVRIRLDLEAGRLRPEQPRAAGEESWITTLRPSP